MSSTQGSPETKSHDLRIGTKFGIYNISEGVCAKEAQCFYPLVGGNVCVCVFLSVPLLRREKGFKAGPRRCDSFEKPVSSFSSHAPPLSHQKRALLVYQLVLAAPPCRIPNHRISAAL